MLEVWPAILAAGTTFAVTQYLMAVYSGPSLIAVVAAAATIAVLVTLSASGSRDAR